MMAIKGRNTMTNEEALERLKMDRDLCNFNPMTGEEEPMNEDCRKSAAALDIAIEALERMSCKDVISKKLAIEKQERYLTIEYLEKMQEAYIEGEGYERHPLPEWYALDVAIKALEQETVKAESEGNKSVTPTTKWIPVSESFPKEHIYDDGYVEPSETVLVQLNNGEMKTSRYWGSRESRKDEPWIDLSYPTTLEVVAWRPLPNKYSTPHDSRCKTEG